MVNDYKYEKASLMAGFDLILETYPDKTDLRQLLSKAFGIIEKSIFISEDIADYPTQDDNALWCVIYQITGEFKALCCFYIAEHNLKNNPICIANRIANHSNSKCLVDDGTIDPFSWNMISPDGYQQIIMLDPEQLNHDCYIIYKGTRSA